MENKENVSQRMGLTAAKKKTRDTKLPIALKPLNNVNQLQANSRSDVPVVRGSLLDKNPITPPPPRSVVCNGIRERPQPAPAPLHDAFPAPDEEQIPQQPGNELDELDIGNENIIKELRREIEKLKAENTENEKKLKAENTENEKKLKAENTELRREIHLSLEKEKKLKTEIEKLREKSLCGICLTANRDVIFLPCKHVYMCQYCANHRTNDMCPICKQPAESQPFFQPELKYA